MLSFESWTRELAKDAERSGKTPFLHLVSKHALQSLWKDSCQPSCTGIALHAMRATEGEQALDHLRH